MFVILQKIWIAVLVDRPGHGYGIVDPAWGGRVWFCVEAKKV
jgi:hypothetical protein